MATEEVLNETQNNRNIGNESVPNAIPNDCDLVTAFVLKEIENDHRAYRIVYRMAFQGPVETTTK